METNFKNPQRSSIAIFALLIVLLFGFCKQETKDKKPSNEGNVQLTISGFDLKHPSQSWKLPEQAEIIGRVVGVVMRFNNPWQFRFAEYQGAPGGLNKKAL